jgi:HlyD family secretion protein
MRRYLRWLVVLGILAGLTGAVGISALSWWQQHAHAHYLTATISRGRVETVVNSTGTIKPVRTVSVGAFTSGPIKEVLVDYNSVVVKMAPTRPGFSSISEVLVDYNSVVFNNLPELLRETHLIVQGFGAQGVAPAGAPMSSLTLTLAALGVPERPATLLAVIDPQLAQAALDRDQAALDRDRALLKTQEADLKRVKALLKQAENNLTRARRLTDINKEYLSDTDLDQFLFTHLSYLAQQELGEANITQAAAGVRQSEANVANSRTNLGYTKIFAPEDGIVIERKVDPGQTVAASFQTPELLTIALEMDRHMYVYASVDEADIGLIKIAMERNRARSESERKRLAKFTVDAYPGELFEGDVHDVRQNATTTQNVVTYPVVIDAPNLERKLMPSMTANISFQIEAKEDVLRVPAAALRFVPLSLQVRPEDRHYVEALPATPADGAKKSSAGDKADQARKRHERIVWVQDGDWLRAVPVTLGLIENQFAELLSGDLAEGQTVVTGTESVFAPR